MKWIECPVRSVIGGTAMMFIAGGVLLTGIVAIGTLLV